MLRSAIPATDYHTGGEPFRIVTDPPVPIWGRTVAERRAGRSRIPRFRACKVPSRPVSRPDQANRWFLFMLPQTLTSRTPLRCAQEAPDAMKERPPLPERLPACCGAPFGRSA